MFRIRTTVWLLLALAPGLLSLLPVGAAAQNADLITGVIIGRDSLPLERVTIEAMSLESQIVRSTATDELGRFTILFPDGGGQYRMSARRIGLVPAEAILIRYADEDRLVWDIQMAAQALRLEDIEVTAESELDETWAETILGRRFTADELAALTDLVDFNLLALFVDGVLPIDATDSTEAAISVGGLGADANLVTVDGMEASADALPTEGLESVEVLTDSYDVSTRGFGGATIRARTRGGTNVVRGSAQYSLHDPRLAFGGTDQSPFGRASTMNRISGGIGGPLIRNKLFINVSGRGDLRSNPLRSLSTATPTDLQRLGVARDSVNRLLTLSEPLGLLTGQPYGTSASNNRVSALVRLDYLLSERHTLSATGSWQTQGSDPARSSQLAFTDAAGVSTSDNGSVSLRLASQLGLQWSNQFSTSLQRRWRDQDPFLFSPQARVRVASELADGSTGITTLVAGGNTGMPTTSRETSFEVQNRISWLSGGGGHRLRLGGDFQYQNSESVSSSNQLGTFSFNSLADFESGNAASFRRTLAPSIRTTRAMSYEVFASDAWRSSPSLQLTYGIRIGGASSPSPPPYNPALDALFDRRTDRLPATLSISPSTGFTWSLGQRQGSRPALIVRGGVSLTQGRGGRGYASRAQRATGLPDEEREINCVGAAVPALDWLAFLEDVDAIPTACDDGTFGVPVTTGTAPTATVFSPEYSPSKSLRTSLSLQRNVTSFLRATLSGRYTRGFDLASVTDLNLNTTGGFRLANEGDRPVFVPPDAIATPTGALRLSDSRIDEAFSQVQDIASHGISEAKQLTASLRGATNDGITLSASYTWSHVRDRVTGFSGGPTAGDPNVLEWGPSSRGRTHSLTFRIGYPVGTNLEISASSRFVSGSAYTPVIGSDLNGDGSRNDRAFVFSPDAATTDAPVAAGIEQLLDTTSPSARRCLERQMGRIAERNSCIGPWSSSVDLNINYRPAFLGLDRRLSISVQTSNLLRGLDDLFHGADNAHGWGMQSRPNSTLLFVTGFDPDTRQFEYAVNERFGVSDPRAIASRAPFQITISARFQFGPDRRRDAIDRLRGIRPSSGGGGARGRGAPAQLTASSFGDRLSALVMDPAAIALGMRDSLALTDDQVTRLQTLSDSAAARRAALVKEVQARVETGGQRDARTLAQLLRTMTGEALSGAREDLAAVRGILTDEQWALLPEEVRQGADAGRPAGRRRRN